MILLASNSPRRRQLLALTGLPFSVQAAEIDERPLDDEQPLAYVRRLAVDKARAVASKSGDAYLVLAADTTVVDGGEMLGKPADAADAEQMLRRIRGRTHQVYTAIAVLRTADSRLSVDWCVTDVLMRTYSDTDMQAYIASGDPLDKAGGYAIQHKGFKPVQEMQSCFANVVGLPLCHLVRTMNELGVLPLVDVPRACQDTFGYTCPIYDQVLQGTL